MIKAEVTNDFVAVFDTNVLFVYEQLKMPEVSVWFHITVFQYTSLIYLKLINFTEFYILREQTSFEKWQVV